LIRGPAEGEQQPSASVVVFNRYFFDMAFQESPEVFDLKANPVSAFLAISPAGWV
jgi:hypothetical protein